MARYAFDSFCWFRVTQEDSVQKSVHIILLPECCDLNNLIDGEFSYFSFVGLSFPFWLVVVTLGLVTSHDALQENAKYNDVDIQKFLTDLQSVVIL